MQAKTAGERRLNCKLDTYVDVGRAAFGNFGVWLVQVQVSGLQCAGRGRRRETLTIRPNDANSSAAQPMMCSACILHADVYSKNSYVWALGAAQVVTLELAFCSGFIIVAFSNIEDLIPGVSRLLLSGIALVILVREPLNNQPSPTLNRH